MLPPGGGTNKVDPRFLSLFTMFNILFPSVDVQDKIYCTILSSHLAKFNNEEFNELP